MFLSLYRVLLIFFILLTLAGCNFFDNGPIKIGFIGTLSGPHNFLGKSAHDGVLLAVTEINRQGGINGRPVELVVRDDHHNQARARKAFSELVQEKVIAVIGPMTSGMAVSVAEIANRQQTLLISPTASTQDLAGIDDYFLRLYPTASEGTIKITHFSYHDRKLDSFAIVYDMTNANFSLSWLENFKRDYLSVGGTIKAQIPFESQKAGTSYQELAQRIKSSDCKGVLILANPFATAMLYQNLDKIDANLETYATEWSYGPDLIDYGGSNINKLLLFKTYFKDSSDPAVVTFRNRYEQQFGNTPWFSSVHSYDATRFLISALQKNTDKTQLKETLIHYGAFGGVQAKFELTTDGDIIRPHYITRLNQESEYLVARLEIPAAPPIN